jgi:hypothetical protein
MGSDAGRGPKAGLRLPGELLPHPAISAVTNNARTRTTTVEFTNLFTDFTDKMVSAARSDPTACQLIRPIDAPDFQKVSP